jgi:ketosteroid isomerase-like protein
MNQALSSQNDSAIAMVYDTDAVTMPPNVPRVVGRPAIRAFFARIWPLKAVLSLAPTSVRVAGEWAIEEGNWNWTMPAPHGDVRDHGKYLVTWHQNDGEWLIKQDIWNSDTPVPPPPAAVEAPSKRARR